MAQPKEEVVISGIGAVFPECSNMDEFKELLFDKTNGVTIASKLWNTNDPEKIHGTGKVKGAGQFDSTFFSAHPKLTENTDPLTMQFLERSVEAIIDAGLSPMDLHGTNTAVFAGSGISESEVIVIESPTGMSFTMLGCSRAMQPNRVSYILNLTGPSICMDGAWMCGSNGLERAKKMIEDGIVSAAIVGVSNLIFRPELQYQSQGLNRLNRNDRTKSFSSDADGYNRSEACVVMLLQRASEAKRSYGTLLGVKSRQFGDSEQHMMEHSRENFKSTLLDCYREANVDPATIEYVEAHGSGIKCEDGMELDVMDEVFCTENRKTPLKIGSAKSNVGHCEAAALFVSVAKAIIALDGGYVPPNINYTGPNENVAALKTGKIQVVTEKTPLAGDVVGISSFGTINAFSHVIIRRNGKVKRAARDEDGDLPRLLLASGRSEENTLNTIKKIKVHGNDEEFVALTNNVFTRNINAHFFRSFSIFPSLDESRIDDVWNVNQKKRPVWFVFSGMGSQWHGMGAELMKLPIFARAIDKCDAALGPLGVDIKRVLTSQNPKIFDNILNSFVGIAAVQIGLVDVLRALDVTPDGIIGHSVGELGCAYADGCFTAEEMILSAHARGRASLETLLIPGMMAAIGLGYDQIKDRLPADIDVACRNSSTSCTISGPTDSIERFVSELKSDGVFAKSVNAAGIAYHSRYIQSAGPTLLKYLKEVIGEPKPRSSKWISSSVPESQWHSELAKYSSPEYHTNNLLSSVLFEDALKHVPDDAVAIEIAPHGLLQAILRGALPDTVTNIPLTKRMFGDSVRFLLTAVGKMYTSGLHPKIQELYPKVTFPVSRGTPSIHSLPFWDHSHQWKTLVSTLESRKNLNSAERSFTTVLNDDIHLVEHRIHNEHIMPLSYILVNVWKAFVEIYDKTFSKESIQFRDLRFKRDVKIHPINPSDSYLMIQWGSGLFEYMVDGVTVLTGQIAFLFDHDANTTTKTKDAAAAADKTSDDFEGSTQKNEIYDILEHNGFDLGDNFKNITRCEIYKHTIRGYVQWNNDWIYFLDGLLKFPALETIGAQNVEFPEAIREIRIVPKTFEENVEKDQSVDYNRATKDIVCNGVQILGIKNSPLTASNKSTAVKLEEQAFVHFNHSKCENIKNFIDDTMDVIMEANRLGLDITAEKLIVYTPHHYDDAIVRECTKSIKQIVENQTSVNSKTLSWENVRNQTEDDRSGTFITVTNVDYLKDTTKALANKTYVYVIVCSKRRLEDLKDWKIVTQQEYDVDNFLVLMKKKIPLDTNSAFIAAADHENDMSVWRALENTEGTVYIISKREPSENNVKTTLNKYKSQRLRFLFILDADAPEFESATSFYTDHLSIGSIVNIYKNGGWGSYKRLALRNVKQDDDDDVAAVSGGKMFENFTADRKNGLTVTHLGLNFNDLVIDNDTENSFGPFEYSGTVDDNSKVMGIASCEPASSKLHYDTAFSWPVPSAWTSEDAATVPLSYALSYYVFNVLCSLKNDKSILVNSALHPIGRAAISICLAEECETYAIVESDREADQLSNTFPKLPRSRIVVNTNKVDVKLKMMKPGGFDYVLNFLSDESFQSAFRMIAKHGKFFQFSKSDMKNKSHIGTRRFLQNISMTVVSSNLLLNESDDAKQIIRQAFADGLNKGVIKPYRNRVVPASSGCDKIFDTMRIGSEKVVLPLVGSRPQKEAESLTYQFNSDHVHVIIGNKSDWMDLSEWLVDRGARKIVIVVNRYLMSSITYKRFDRLLSRKVSIKIESDHQLRTDAEPRDWLNHLTSSEVLGSLFIVNQTDVKKVENLRRAYENHANKTTKTSFVCVSSKGQHACAKLKSNGLNALNITWDGALSQPKQTAQILQSLDTLLRESHAKECSSFVCSYLGSNESGCFRQTSDIIATFFPESADELQLLNDKLTGEASFVEIQTNSPRFSQVKSVAPVFVVPGFKPKLIGTFYKHCMYPVFEARLPEHFHSIDELSEVLVNKLKRITNADYVSLIGESWGGMVALKMAQILEAQGILTTVALIEGSPDTMKTLAKNYLSSDNFANRLETLYSSFSNEFLSHELQNCDEKSYLRNIASYQNSLRTITKTGLNAIRVRLQAVLESRPLSNKLHSKVLILKSKQFTNLNEITLNDYCVRSPLVYMTTADDYKQMMTDKGMVEVITKNSAHSFPAGVDSSLAEKYRNFYFFSQKYLKIE